MRFEGLRMNLVYHDVNVKVLLVIVRGQFFGTGQVAQKL